MRHIFCSAGRRSRRLRQITAGMPASPVAPPIMPLMTPTVPSVTIPARVAELKLRLMSEIPATATQPPPRSHGRQR